tara:strand:+ start:20721 stop:21848 length:1128 start_codon:yes stop_codon:yes gene_type:complete
MRHYLVIQKDTSIYDALAGIPAGVSKLSLSGGGLYANNYTQLEHIFEAIPQSVVSLDLSLNEFENKTGAELAVAFASIPAHVTSVDFSMCDLYLKSGAELARALAGLPDTVTSLDLSGNDLYKKKSDELALGLSGISAGVNTLILAGNGFGHKTSAQLARVLAGIPISVTLLELSHSQLGYMCPQDLRDFIQIIPLHIKFITLKNNGFFNHKTPQEIDRFLVELGEARTRLDLSCNGEPELARVIAPLVPMETSGVAGVGRHVTLPTEVIAHIASFLSDIPEQSIYHQMKTRAQMVGHRKARDVYIASWFQFSHDILSMPPAQFAMIALGLSLFFHANPTEMFVFGTGLTLFGAAGFAKSMHDVVSVPTALNALN